MIQPNYYFSFSFRVRLLRGAGAEDGGAPLRGHDGVVPHVRHLRHVLHAPRASQGKTSHYGGSSSSSQNFNPPEEMQLQHLSQRELNC